jgi:ABC-type antimicrobial peptide transport system permease subunit
MGDADRSVGYARALLTRWSRRDRLTVLVVAVTTAFLIGTALLVAAAGAQTTTLAGEYDITTADYHDSSAAARAAAGRDDLVFPTAVLRGPNGTEHRFLGVPPEASANGLQGGADWQRTTLPTPNGSVRGPVAVRTQQRFGGPGGTAVYDVRPHETGDSLFPPEWYVANASMVTALGGEDAGAIVIEPDRTNASLASLPASGTPVQAALVFLLTGMREMLTVLLAATLGGAVLVLVVVYNVLRMTVRDRLRTIAVIRATGGSPWRVLSLFGLRAGLIVAVGVALGYALGVILTNAIVNAAIYGGLPIALTPSLTPLALTVIAPVTVVLLLVGVVAGVLAARSAATRPPARLDGSADTPKPAPESGPLGRLRAALTPTLLAWRTIVPTATTLAVVAVVVVLVTSLAGAVAPLASQDGGTIAEGDATHVINSRIDTSYASALRSEGIAASPEIVLPEAIDGEPFLGLGANYTAFASVTNATLTLGRAPNGSEEAVVGADLADTLGIGVGDALVLGGSFSPAVTRVTVVGEFAAPGIDDDQLVVPLATAHHLSIRSGQVQYIRTAGSDLPDADRSLPDVGPSNESINVTGVSAPTTAVADEPLPVEIRLHNRQQTSATRRLTVRIGNATRTRSVTLEPDERTRIEMNLSVPRAGNRTLRVGSVSQSVRVFAPNALRLPPELPPRGPPNATLFVPVVTPTQTPVENVTVRIGTATASTGRLGVAEVRLPAEPGTYTIAASKGDRSAAPRRIEVSSTARRRLGARITVTPKTATVLERPRANVTVANPWNATLTREIALVSPVSTRTRNVTLAPSETAAVEVDLTGGGSDERASPGTYTVEALSKGTALARTEFTIIGDDRLSSALASTGEYSTGTGVGHAVRSVFGNIQLVLGAMVALAGLTTVGTTTATFAQVIHARRRAIGIHRATGATPRGVLSTVLVDVCLLSVPAVVIATGLAVATTRLLGAMGTLTVFGIRLSTQVPVTVLLGAAAGSFLVALFGAVLATVPFLRSSPTALVAHTGSNDGSRARRGRS